MNPHDSLFRYLKSKAPISEEEFSRFKDLFTYQKVKANEFLLREGDVCMYNYFVLKGSFRFYHVNPEGQELTRYFAFENKFALIILIRFLRVIISLDLLIINVQPVDAKHPQLVAS